MPKPKLMTIPEKEPAVIREPLTDYLAKPPKDARGRIYCPLADEYRIETPEEKVRQGFIMHLIQHYGYSIEQMRQECRTQAGRRSPRTDIVIWQSREARLAKQRPAFVVECKAESVDIQPTDFFQGESYARAVSCEILVMHNERQTAVYKLIPGTPGEAVPINEIPKAADWSDAQRIEAIKNSTRAFSRKEFQDLLFKCHSILRDVHKMEPGRAFDTISKILFVKMFIERTGSWGTFTTEYLDGRVKYQLRKDKPIHELLFEETKDHYKQDDLFTDQDNLEISGETFRRIVKELERFNLSATGDDVKGLAFEKFLGDTFRGNLGQFFTPRPIVNFMVDLLDPQEDELICDPASGSGGFLIRAFEHVRRKIHADIQKKKETARAEIEARKLPEDKEIELIEKAFAKLNRDLDPEQAEPQSRVRKLAFDCMFGTDAEPRAARTSKMNMIMHGDGHGGIHYHDGFVDINGIYPERFNVILTNPPFGSTVGSDQKFGSSEQTRVPVDAAYVRHCKERYGAEWIAQHAKAVKRMENAEKILDAFEIGKGKPNRDTELLFIERCLQLLIPGGRMGIVLPDGNLNNPSLAWLRRWAEGKAKLLAVVSLPEETFASADATVKASLVFLRRFTALDEKKWEAAWAAAHKEHDKRFNAERTRLCEEFGPRFACADKPEHRDALKQLAALGINRMHAEWQQDEPPPYPRGVGATRVGKPKWSDEAKDKKHAREVRRALDAAWTDDDDATVEKLLRQLRAALRKVDMEHNLALWRSVRAAFDYPVFTAAPDQVGITSTGADGPNQLPDVLKAWREFEAWSNNGANEKQKPVLAV